MSLNTKTSRRQNQELGSTPGIKDVASLTKGKGERLKVAVPLKFSNATDVYLFLNYDKRALMRFDPKLYGGGAGVTHALSPDATVKAEVAVDASQRQVQTAGYIKLELVW